MASPHVAGAAALLLQAKPNTNPGSVRTIFQNSADPAPWWGNPALGFLDNVHRQGAGMLDVDDAILAETEVSPSKLALGESESGPAARQIEIWNREQDRGDVRPLVRERALDEREHVRSGRSTRRTRPWRSAPRA